MVRTGIPLGILPTGTGNLLVRNLGIPISVDDAIAVALTGRDRLLDCGRVGGSRFVVMAGIGLDAAMVRDAPARTKKALGWPAYVLSGARHVNDPAMRVRFRLDDGPWQSRRARMLVAGNVGELQGGLALFPDADPATACWSSRSCAPGPRWTGCAWPVRSSCVARAVPAAWSGTASAGSRCAPSGRSRSSSTATTTARRAPSSSWSSLPPCSYASRDQRLASAR
jgi:hypothetical protein